MPRRGGPHPLAVLIAVVVVWITTAYGITSEIAQTDDWNGIRLSEAVLKEGDKPSDWPIRTFVPASVLQSAAGTLKDAEISLPLGDAKAGLNWPRFRPDTRRNLEGLRLSSSTGLCLTIISALN